MKQASGKPELESRELEMNAYGLTFVSPSAGTLGTPTPSLNPTLSCAGLSKVVTVSEPQSPPL